MKKEVKVTVTLTADQWRCIRKLATYATDTRLKTDLETNERLLICYEELNDAQKVAEARQNISETKADIETVEVFKQAIIDSMLDADLL